MQSALTRTQQTVKLIKAISAAKTALKEAEKSLPFS